ncbi:MAG: hypothetical protein IH612_20130 [Desulfofustis sp.]|nr:hypothetical protein [Desulfofustis sp.]
MLFFKSFHLLVAVLFLFQVVLPAHLPAVAAPVATDQATAEERPDNPLSSLYAETAVLANISVEMKTLLGELHERYPEQFRLWQALLATLQDSDPRKQELTEQAGTTETFLSLLMGYSTSFDTLQQQLLAQLEESGETPELQINQLVASLYTVLQYQEKIGAYELLAQGQIQDIHLLARTISATDEQQQINAAIEAFETYRRQIIRQVTTVRQEFEQVRSGFADLNQAGEEITFAPIRQEVAAYQELAERLAAGQRQDSAGAGRDFLAQLEQIAANRQRDMEATLAAMSDGREGTSWPLFYQPGVEQKSSAPSDWSFTPERLLSVMAEMRTAFIELADILHQRNTLLLDSALLQRDDLFWLAAHIELENLQLERLAEIIAATGKPAPQGDRDAYHQSMVQWEEFGLLKEDILAMEALIVNELTVSRADETLADDESWQPVADLLQRQIDWRSGWIPIATSLAQVVEGFKTFQAELLQEKLQAIETLRADIKRSQLRLANQPDSPLAQFLTLIDEALAEQLEETRVYSDLKAETHRQEQADPLFSSFFGIRSERFFNDFKYMGAGLWDHAALTANLARSRAHLLALNNSGTKQHRQALLILQLADQLGVIDRIDYDAASCTVHLRSTSHTMILAGCGREALPELRSAAIDRSVPPSLTACHLMRSLFSFASPAHAGLYEQFTGWSRTSFNQMKKNWVNYAVTGVVIVGALAAAPVVAAVGATAATVATVGAAGATVALGAKAAFYAQATADIAVGTSRHTINQMDFSRSKYSWATKEYFTTKIDQLETAYNIAKIAEGFYKIYKVKSAPAAQMKDAQQATQARQLTLAKRVADNERAMENLGQQLKGSDRYSKFFRSNNQSQLSKLKTLNKVLKQESVKVGLEGEKQIEKIAANATSLVSRLTRHGEMIAEASGVPPNAASAQKGMEKVTTVPDGNLTPGANASTDGTSGQDLAGNATDKPDDQDSNSSTDTDATSELKQKIVNGGDNRPTPTTDQTIENDYIGNLLTGGWAPAATLMTEAERQRAADIDAKLAQLKADLQRMRSVYQSRQTQNQQQSAASMAQIERDRSTQIGDAIFSGFTSGVAQGVGTFGERVGQGAGTRIAQDTGLVDRHPTSPAPGQSGGGEGQAQTAGDCPTDTTYDPASQTCVQQDNTAKSYRGAWRASSTCAANFSSKGTGTCSWNGSAQITLHPGGRVSGTITGGSRFNWNEGGNFTGCGGGSSTNSISGSHTNGSFSGSMSNGARISGTYTDAAISGTTKGSATNAVSGGRSMSCTTSGSMSLSR